ncbi:MAG: DEAD/DEAH box helicase, partial [Spirochaetia bacterium]
SGEPAETEGKTDENTKWFISAHDEIEEHFILRLITVLDKHSIETEPDPQEQKRVPSRFLVSSSISDIISKAGNELLFLGFELRLQRRKVAHPPRKLAVRVSSSGEEWLTFEAGLETDEGFIPIEDIPARGIAEAGGKTYVLPPGSDPATVISEMQRKRIGRRDLTALEAIADAVSNPDHPALQDFFSLRRRLSSFSSLREAEVPDSFEGSLRPYQKSGLSWLWFLHTYKLGGCLADDMGLGKTIQALALLAKAREAGEMRRALVVCPVSTLGNWLSETRRFTPKFSAHIHAGQGRAAEAEELEAADIIFTGYATLLRDAELMRNLDLDYLILDEAQAIKNPKTKRRKTVVSITAAHRLALTGTPIENSTVELWSLFDFLMPGIFGKRAKFTRKYGSDIERTGALPAPKHVALQQGDGGISSSPGGRDTGKDTAAEKLRRIIRPLLLRRTKAAVAPELPPKEEQILYAEAGGKQAEVYESLRLRYAEEVEELLISGEAGLSAMKILEAMLRLRQAAILPSIVDPDFSEVASAKMDLLYDRLIELKVEGNKALVFSQFTAVLDEVELRMAGTGAQLFRLDGSTPQKKRDIQIERFQNAVGSAFFLISLKAGGVGINLTAADYVFLLDPWWNPAVESQAIDRTHRIGREGTVIAYRLITRGTIEEKMLRLQEKKRRISESLIRGESGALRELSKEDIRALFQ